MPQQQQPTIQPAHLYKDEEFILVVKRKAFFPTDEEAWHGIRSLKSTNVLETILEQKEFMPRSLMEVDPTYKQIIPYLVFKYNTTYFLMQRHPKASETRLQGKMSLGIGGHIRQEDIQDGNIVNWAAREFQEEVEYAGNFSVTPIGILNDDSNDVGKVHIGIVYLLEGDSPHISVKEELKSGTLLTLEECSNYYGIMESWTQIVFDFLTKNT